MAKSLSRLEAEKLRKQGKSVREIAKILGVSKGSVSLWTRDIILTDEQIKRLNISMGKGAALGRMKSALIHKQKREKIREASLSKGIKKLLQLKDREVLIAGLALYWGEGCKKKHGVEFCNSDPKMLKFVIDWLKYCFDIPLTDLSCRVGINMIHTDRDKVVKDYWSFITGIPLGQFTKSTFKQVNSKKVYKDPENHFGTLTIRVKKPGILYHRIIGLIDALYLVEQRKINNG